MAGWHNIEVVPPQDTIRPTLHMRHHDKKMCFLHRAMTIMREPLMSASGEAFITTTPLYRDWKGYVVLLLYCCEIPDGKDISCIPHGHSVNR